MPESSFAPGPASTPRKPRTHAPAPADASPSSSPSSARGTWGRTQYVLRSSHGRAQPAMRSEYAGAPPSPPLSPLPELCKPLARIDPMTHVSHPDVAPRRAGAALCPVDVEGLGRVVMPPLLVGAPPSSDVLEAPCASKAHTLPVPPAWPDSPHNAWSGTYEAAARHTAQRRHQIARWLARASLSDSEDDAEENAQQHATESYHHPMVAKLLRDQCRRHRVPRMRHTSCKDWWIGADGRRGPRPGTTPATGPKRRLRRRMAHTTHALTARGIAPVMGCRCGFTDPHMDMVQCDGCSRWLHLACVGVCHVDQLGAHDWVCDDCYERAAGVGAADAKLPRGARAGFASHAHPGAMLSLAPSPQRMRVPREGLGQYTYAASDIPLTSPLSSAASEHAWRTPSPPPSMDILTTPSRHVAPSEMQRRRTAAPSGASPRMHAADLLPTPSRYLMQTPHAALSTPMYDTHTPTTRALYDWPSTVLLPTPHDAWASGTSAWGLASVTPTPTSSAAGSARRRHDAWAAPDSPTQATRGARARQTPASPLACMSAPAPMLMTPRAARRDEALAPSSPPQLHAGTDEEGAWAPLTSSSPYPETPTHTGRAHGVRPLAGSARAKQAGRRMHAHLDGVASGPKAPAPPGLLPSLPGWPLEDVE
ncbi:hypothetical protein MBRA1_002052 [Malassezia brasiliensis]|uniref:PHD-type domain-containing protein n=1 Tax=Malassezia brasiliensis TaxID=1821822 RepID=A0AAF0DTL5_9BASI|nr:hypothetical protein MBRA1_002052 [Malassezia brasiliensis]